MRHSGNQQFAYRYDGSHFVVTREPPSTSANLDRANRTCTVAATFGDEASLARARVEGHNYKVVDGPLVDLGPLRH
jgi:hypothetical protein